MTAATDQRCPGVGSGVYPYNGARHGHERLHPAADEFTYHDGTAEYRWQHIETMHTSRTVFSHAAWVRKKPVR